MHVWDLALARHPWLCEAPLPNFRYGDYHGIRRTYLDAHYRADCAALPIAGTVYVETEWDRTDPVGETRWVHRFAAERGLVQAVVAHAQLDAPNVAEVLAAQAAFPLVRGIRHKPAAADSPTRAVRGAAGSMDDPRWREGYAHLARHRLSFDLQVPWWHLDAAADLARDHAETLLILNHAGLPSDRSHEGLAGWSRALETLAREPNTRIKISGIGVPGTPWAAAGNAPIVRTAIEIFGDERAMFASNFPVDSLVGDLPTIFAGYAAAIPDEGPDLARRLFFDNAAAAYRIDPTALDSAAPTQREDAT